MDRQLFELPRDFSPFFEAWNGLPRGAHPHLPQKSDISPVHFGKFLHLCGLAEMIAPGQLTIRFSGSEFERIAGLNLSGRNYYDLVPLQFHAATRRFHATILETPCGAYVCDLISSTSGNRYFHETVHLPVTDAAGHVRFILIYGVGRKPLGDRTERRQGDHNESNIKELHYLDLGAGAPAERVSDFRRYRAASTA